MVDLGVDGFQCSPSFVPPSQRRQRDETPPSQHHGPCLVYLVVPCMVALNLFAPVHPLSPSGAALAEIKRGKGVGQLRALHLVKDLEILRYLCLYVIMLIKLVPIDIHATCHYMMFCRVMWICG